MKSRALSLAAVTLLIGIVTAGAARAQNLEAGKTPSQIFAGTCSACHKSPRGLAKTVSASALPGFLRQHYTTSSDMASLLAGYLVSNGAVDTRYQAKQEPAKPEQSKQGQGRDAARQEAPRSPGPLEQLFGRKRQPAEEASPPQNETAGQTERRRGRNAKRHAAPGDEQEATDPAQAESKSGRRQKSGKRAKPVEDAAKPESAKPDTAKEEPARSEPKAEPDKAEAPKETGPSATVPTRPDPVPPVTPAPPGPAPEPAQKP